MSFSECDLITILSALDCAIDIRNDEEELEAFSSLSLRINNQLSLMHDSEAPEVTEGTILEHQRLANLLKETKASEMALRKKIVKSIEHIDGKGSKQFGSLIVDSKKPTTTKIDDKEGVLDDRDGWNPELQDCFELDVKYSKTAYDKLDDDDKATADCYLSEKPAAPTIKVKGAK